MTCQRTIFSRRYRFKVADLARQGSLADNANKRARQLVESWTVHGASGSGSGSSSDDSKEARIERGSEPDSEDILAARGVGSSGGGGSGGGVDEERGHPESLGLLLALCGLDTDAKALLGDFESPAPRPPSRAAGGIAAAAVAGVEGRREASLPSEAVEEAEAEAGGNGTDQGETGSEVVDGLPSSAPMPAVIAPSAAGTPSAAEHSVLDAEKASQPEGAAVDVGDGWKEQEQSWQQEQRALPTACFEDEEDFLEKSAAEYADLMVDQEEDEEYLSGFSFAPPPDVAAESPPAALGGAEDRRSEADRFRQLQLQQQQQQQRGRAADRRQDGLVERVPPPSAPRPPLEPITAPVGNGARGSAVAATPAGLWTGGGGDTAVEPGPPVAAAAEGEPSIIRRANLLEGGQTIVLIDLETTGLGPKKDRVVQLAGKVRVVFAGFPALVPFVCLPGTGGPRIEHTSKQSCGDIFSWRRKKEEV